MNDKDKLLISKILQFIDEVEKTVERFNLTLELFQDDFVARNAISMCILQIGELVGNLSEDFKQKYNKMPWREIKAMRNIAAHNYGEIDIDILWETVTEDLPQLKNYLEEIKEC